MTQEKNRSQLGSKDRAGSREFTKFQIRQLADYRVR